MKNLFKKYISGMTLLLASVMFALCAHADSRSDVNDPLETGKYYLSVNQHQKALDEFEAVLTSPGRDSVKEEALYKKAFTLLLMRRDREALENMKLYLQTYPKGKYGSEVRIIYRGFKAEEEYHSSWYGKLFENSLIGPTLSVGLIILWIYALADLRKTNLPVSEKSIWVILIVFIPLFGVIIYYWAKHYRKFSNSW